MSEHPPSTDHHNPAASAQPVRRTAAQELTRHLESTSAFSFLRLGDGEIQCIRAIREGQAPPRYRSDRTSAASIEAPFSVSGIEARHLDRVLKAFRNCTYLDYCDSIPAVQEALPTLGLQRAPGALRNHSPETSNIVFEWTAFELPEYLQRHRCLLASAESQLLKELCDDPRYQALAADYLPFGHLPVFHQLRNNGRQFSENLDLIKADLREEIERHNIDTMFLSMATGAKILCYELAQELGIRCIDFGSMTRALTYSGSPGYHSHRNFHNPFLFRVPLDIYLPALQRAQPDLTLPEQVSKAQAQVLLELYDLQPFRFNNSEAVAGADIVRTPEALGRFRAALNCYNTFYQQQARHDAKCQQLQHDFVRWRQKKGIGLDGKIFLSLVKCKALLRKLLGPIRGAK